VTEDAFVILSVGELKPHKNHKTVIDAIAQIDRKNIIYLICGKGELLNKLQKKAKRLRIEEKVKFLGYRKDVHEIMQCADIFVFPSKREGLGLASLEAMAAGLPIVGAKTRGVVDYVVDDKTGYLCGVENPNDYASAILKLYDNQNKIIQMSLRCKEAVIKYDIKTIQQRIFKEIEELMRL
ncbi:MAG: glycosyltransferase family 4 protein, partial [Clostridia bacterium]|nr:glycosyltransferase family 4 protein [Clostridia bacterium]